MQDYIKGFSNIPISRGAMIRLKSSDIYKKYSANLLHSILKIQIDIDHLDKKCIYKTMDADYSSVIYVIKQQISGLDVLVKVILKNKKYYIIDYILINDECELCS